MSAVLKLLTFYYQRSLLKFKHHLRAGKGIEGWWRVGLPLFFCFALQKGRIWENREYTLNPESGEEETDLCKALEQIERHAMKKGVKQGERRGTLMTLFSLVNDGLIKLGEAARRAGLSEAAFCSEMRKAGYHIN